MARPIKATPRLSAKQFRELGEKLDANTEHKELVMVDNEVKPPETVDRIVTISKEEYENLQSGFNFCLKAQNNFERGLEKWNRSRLWHRIALAGSVVADIALIVYLVWR